MAEPLVLPIFVGVQNSGDQILIRDTFEPCPLLMKAIWAFDAIASRTLRGVKHLVSIREQRIEVKRALLAGKPEARSQANGLGTVFHHQPFNGCAQTLGQRCCLSQPGKGQHNDELLTTESATDIAVPNRVSKCVRQRLKYLVAAVMTVGVIDSLKMIDVERNRRYGRLGGQRVRSSSIAPVPDHACLTDW